MKLKQKVDLSIAIVLILIGVVLLVLPLTGFVNINISFISVMSLYVILNLVQFILTRKDKDYEGIHTSIASLIVLVLSIIFKVGDKPISLALCIMSWVILMSLIKLKKTDYYDDRNDRMWKLRVLTLVLFMLTGFLTAINLYYEKNVQTLVLGYFFLIHGFLEIVDPMTKYLIGKK